ncbi:MAG: HAMP domain-containing protein [Caulobacter sp.]|nr:HAMP domain-containing protein [Caulobacter sp.]
MLLLLTLAAAQLMTVAVVLLMQPPRPSIYRLTEVADALRGRPAAARPEGASRDPPLARSVAATFNPPSGRNDPGGHDRETARALAQLLNVAPDRVRVIEDGPPFPYSIRFRDHGFADGKPRFRTAGPGPGARKDPFADRGPGGRPPDDFQRPLLGSFTAALRQVDGSWVVVRPPPEGFPNPWQKRILIWLAGCLLVVAPAGYLFARRITAPLRAFARAAERLGRDPGLPAMSLSGPAEIGAAAQAFNEMQARLARYVEDRTAMVGAISHDLRTPLARMRFKLESAPDALKGSLGGDIDQMEAMISAVLSFIRDASAVRDRRRLDLLSVLEVVADDAELLGGDVSVETGAPLILEADALALQRLFANLVDNAVKYGGQARIRLTREGDEAVVRIADAGPGLPPGELERVFQPFYRAEAARTLEGGVGLGLAAARSIARAHGGDVSLLNGPGGLTAIVRLPLPQGD